jgi:hypothetical protein
MGAGDPIVIEMAEDWRSDDGQPPIRDRFRCPCSAQKDKAPGGWDCMVLLGEPLLALGETRCLGFVFLSGQKAADIMRAAGTIYLWDPDFFGEATVVESKL